MFCRSAGRIWAVWEGTILQPGRLQRRLRSPKCSKRDHWLQVLVRFLQRQEKCPLSARIGHKVESVMHTGTCKLQNKKQN